MTAISSPERNYHIFYELMAGAGLATKGDVLNALTPQHLTMMNKVIWPRSP